MKHFQLQLVTVAITVPTSDAVRELRTKMAVICDLASTLCSKK